MSEKIHSNQIRLEDLDVIISLPLYEMKRNNEENVQSKCFIASIA